MLNILTRALVDDALYIMPSQLNPKDIQIVIKKTPVVRFELSWLWTPLPQSALMQPLLSPPSTSSPWHTERGKNISSFNSIGEAIMLSLQNFEWWFKWLQSPDCCFSFTNISFWWKLKVCFSKTWRPTEWKPVKSIFCMLSKGRQFFQLQKFFVLQRAKCQQFYESQCTHEKAVLHMLSVHYVYIFSLHTAILLPRGRYIYSAYYI